MKMMRMMSFGSLSPQERLEAISQMLGDEGESKTSISNSSSSSSRANRVKEGDMLQVYVLSVFPQF